MQILKVAAFTEQMFGGNPTAVMPLDESLDDSVMRNITIENSLSETAFFAPAISIDEDPVSGATH